MRPDCRHWIVTSPELTTPYSSWEPQETYCCFAEVEGDTARHAMTTALGHRDMADWLKYARSEGKNPFSGLKATRPFCHHDICWGCVEECHTCNEEWLKECEENEY